MLQNVNKKTKNLHVRIWRLCISQQVEAFAFVEIKAVVGLISKFDCICLRQSAILYMLNRCLCLLSCWAACRKDCSLYGATVCNVYVRMGGRHRDAETRATHMKCRTSWGARLWRYALKPIGAMLVVNLFSFACCLRRAAQWSHNP